ncbi:MAG: hypothetical protein H0Z39_08525 [Peptococcaceae bacterium]|nr:hypothetical protein [Peptococcaceae bacterium]
MTDITEAGVILEEPLYVPDGFAKKNFQLHGIVSIVVTLDYLQELVKGMQLRLLFIRRKGGGEISSGDGIT